jgi:hypothetical protein
MQRIIFFKGGQRLPVTKRGNSYIIDEENNVAHIELIRERKENLWTTIDLEDLDRVINFPFSWTTRYDKTLHDYYAVSIVYETDENGIRKGKPLYLHRFIMNMEDENEWVDHINHEPRDNRKENLRPISISDNSRNRKTRNRNNKSGYRNVSWDGSRWVVQLQVNGKNSCLGRFKEEELEQAGEFARHMREKYYGAFAGGN